MERSASFWLGVAFGISFFVVGIPYWRVPYSQGSLPRDLPTAGLVVVGLAVFLLLASRTATFVRATVGMALAVPATVVARVVVEGAQDPTSHNLWPFEVLIALGVGLVAALAGAVGGSLVSWLRGKHAQPARPTA